MKTNRSRSRGYTATMSFKNRSIAVITHANDRFAQGGYLLSNLLKTCQSEGLHVEIVSDPHAVVPRADLAVAHIDITRVADEYAALFNHFPLVINGRVLDIAKPSFSQLIVRRDDPWNGPVIVKTSNNFGGMREMQERHLKGEITFGANVQRPWSKVEHLFFYPIFESRAQVPSGAWRNPNLVVEKYLPERSADGYYLLRNWDFLGDRGIYYVGYAKDPVVKGNNTIRREILDEAEVPGSIRRAREKLGFDYGKFDFGFHQGEAVLYDVNRTPGLPRLECGGEKVIRHIPELAKGLDYFFGKLTA